MRYVKWSVIAALVLLVAGFLHYTLPRHAVVRVVGVETRLETFGVNRWFYSSPAVGTGEGAAVDVRYIETFRPDGRELVFRNEDTGWGWPPYFKNDSADLQARARDVVSTQDAPRWVAVTYYGMRLNLLSVYPNALRIRAVDGPDATPWPIARVVILSALGLLGLWLWGLWRSFRRRRIEPALDAIEDRAEAASGRVGRLVDRLLGRRP